MLTTDILLQAYKMGIFPMAESRGAADVSWYDPPLRGILPIAGMHVPARLRKTVRGGLYGVTFNRAFAGVIAGCAAARPETWINGDIQRLYTQAHADGHAHSVEVWSRDGTLAGGLYGIAIGGAFFGESMFSVRRDASKVGLVHLAARLWRQGFALLDTQFINAHLVQFGCIEISRAAYHAQLARAVAMDVSFAKETADYSAGAEDSSGAFSCEKSDSLTDAALFLQSITQTS